MILHYFSSHTLFQRNSRNPAGTCKEKKTRTENFTEEKRKRERRRERERKNPVTKLPLECSTAQHNVQYHLLYLHSISTAYSLYSSMIAHRLLQYRVWPVRLTLLKSRNENLCCVCPCLPRSVCSINI